MLSANNVKIIKRECSLRHYDMKIQHPNVECLP